MPNLSHEELLAGLIREIRAATDRLHEEECLEEDLPTAASLARHFSLRLENVKKKLRILKEYNIIQVVGITPKRYRFNTWAFRNMEPDHPLHFLSVELDGEATS